MYHDHVFLVDPDHPEWHAIRDWGTHFSDGCTCVKDFYVDACHIHDWYYQTGREWKSDLRLSRAEADLRFRQVIQQHSVFGRCSPMSWWRWAGVRLFGGREWQGD